MASKTSVSGFRGLSTVLSSAVLEWILMFLLFFDGLFSYLVTKFSRVCKLRTPCICCSRLDHIFGNEGPGFYVDLICENHRAEISPFSFCSDHGELADTPTLCRDCFLKHATEKKPLSESYKSLVGKLDHDPFKHGDPWDIQDVGDDSLHKFHEDDLASSPFLEKDVELNAISSLEGKSIRADISEVDIPLPSLSAPRHLQDELGKARERTPLSPKDDHFSDQGFDQFSHIRDGEAKTSASDSESKVSLKDDNERKSLNQDGTIVDDLSSAAKHSSLQVEDGVSKTSEDTMVFPRNHSLHKLQEDDLTSSPFLKKDVELNVNRLPEGKSIKADITEVDIPLSSSPGPSHLQVEDVVRKTWENTPISPKDDQLDNQGFDHFSHVEYSEVTSTSDSESKVPLLDDGEIKPLINEDGNVIDDLVSPNKESESTAVAKTIFPISSFDNRAPEESISLAPVNISDDNSLVNMSSFNTVIDELSEPTPDKKISIAKLSNSSTSLPSRTATEPCLDDSNYDQIEESVHPQFESGPQDPQEVPVGSLAVKDNLESNDLACVHTTTAAASEPGQSTSNHMDMNDAYKFAIGTNGSLSSPRLSEVIKGNNASSGQEDLKMDPGLYIGNHMDLNDVYKLAVGTKERLQSHEGVTMRKNSSSIQEDIKSDSSQSMGNHMDLNDAYKFALGTKGSLTSPRFAEVLMGKDSSRVQEDLKLLISQISAARGLESPWIEMSPSPRSYGQGDEPVLQHITKTLSLERNESGYESLDGSIVSELEGESAVERLKRQVDLDRKSISLLYKELEEERSASAIAANQAMAMITRLQEEKAAMQMEALQYQRMMEEQAEYDQEALQKCNELLTEREKEIQDLEAELESYRKHFADEFSIDKRVEQNGNFLDKEIAFCDEPGETKKPRRSGSGNLNDPLSCFEAEEAYISNCLKRLEEKLQLFSNNGIYDSSKNNGTYDDLSSLNSNDDDDELPDKICPDVHGEDLVEGNVEPIGALGTIDQFSDGVAGSDLEQHHHKDGPLGTVHVGESNKLEEKIRRKVSSSVEGNQNVNFDIEKQYSLKLRKKNDLVSLENEVSRLSQRLEVLAADRNFLEHAINSLRNGNDGVRFIQEIACDLRELRRIGTRDHLAA